ncbi:GyrI-like domain-containing protein [Paenibacillus montanisoli]|uniref:AraC effector-binding domain-containing protein n=1 Tax=Paenibacillus montanisoli TaxID=2081970 RepID=A0A328U4N0_9BACL|nr:GyrI-like domain-containing protein [Paenibacillus montanisoli]RAP75865.1 hypothetical protein DL346_10545 [Paenibacillus montanisoli]
MQTRQVERVDRGEIRLIGFEIIQSLNQVLESKIVGTLRENLVQRRDELEGVLNAGVYLVQIYPEDGYWTHDRPYRHIIALEVAEHQTLPADMIAHTLPGGQYVKTIHLGPESRISETYEYINEHLGHRPVDIEYWHDVHALEREDTVIEMYFPVV